MPQVNAEILRWARETAGLTPAEAAAKLGIKATRGLEPEERLAALERGEVLPTRPLLLRMAARYRRPLVTFYLDAPPRKGDRGQDFRTLPADQPASEEALLDALIRDVRARQSALRALLEAEEEANSLPFIGSLRQADGVPSVIDIIWDTLDTSLEMFRAQHGPDEAFDLVRHRAEDAGVFVLLIGNLGSHHTAIGLETFRGFALADPVAPFIVINDQDARAAWSFTLFHEFAHLILGQTGVSALDARQSVERFCNDVAGQLLLPDSDLAGFAVTTSSSLSELVDPIGQFAGERNVSRSMVAYRLFRKRLIDESTWQELSALFRDRWHDEQHERRERSRRADGGPNYYTVRQHRVGRALIEVVGRMLRGGALTTVKAGQVLGVKSQNVQRLIQEAQGLTGAQ